MVVDSWSSSLYLFLLCLFGKGFRIDVEFQSQNIRNDVLKDIDEQLAEITKDDMVSYAVYYGEFQYQTAMLST